MNFLRHALKKRCRVRQCLSDRGLMGKIFKIILYRIAKQDLNYSGHETSIITETKKGMKLTSFE